MTPPKSQSCRVLFVSDAFMPYIGGAEKSALTILSVLAQQGVEVAVLTNRYTGTKRHESHSNLEINREKLFSERSFDFFQRCLFYLKAIPMIMKYIITFKPDVILTQQLVSIPAITVGNFFHVPVVAIIHDYWPICYYRSLLTSNREICSSYDRCFREIYACVNNHAQVFFPRTKEPRGLPPLFAAVLSIFIFVHTLAAKQLVRRADAIIVVSHFLRKTLISTGIDSRKIKVVYNPVVVDDQRKMEVKGSPHLLYVGRLDIKKGVEFLLKAMQQVCMRVKDARLTIVGDGPREDRFRLLAKSLHIDHCVEFLGKVSDNHLTHLYNSCTVVVVPSIWAEPFGRVVAEAIMHRRPVVASNVGGIPELIDQKTGVLVPPGDVSALAEAITSLITNKVRFQHEPLVYQEFSLERVAELILTIVKTITQTRSG